jgi:hypothetical protein
LLNFAGGSQPFEITRTGEGIAAVDAKYRHPKITTAVNVYNLSAIQGAGNKDGSGNKKAGAAAGFFKFPALNRAQYFATTGPPQR